MIVLILPDTAHEDRLLSQARAGNRDALRSIYDAYYVPVFQFIRMRTGDAATAEDLAADVFVYLVSALRQGKGPRQSLRGWLFQVARNALYDHYHGQAGFAETTLEEWHPIPAEDEPEAEVFRSMRLERARLAIRRLTGDQQEVLILRFGQMLSLRETADIMGKQINAVKQLQLRALDALRRALREYDMVDEPVEGPADD